MVRHVVLVKVYRGKVNELVTKSGCLGCTQKPAGFSGRCTQPEGAFK